MSRCKTCECGLPLSLRRTRYGAFWMHRSAEHKAMHERILNARATKVLRTALVEDGKS